MGHPCMFFEGRHQRFLRITSSRITRRQFFWGVVLERESSFPGKIPKTLFLKLGEFLGERVLKSDLGIFGFGLILRSSCCYQGYFEKLSGR